MSAAFVALLISLVMAALLVATQRWHGRFTHDHTQGVQKFHVHPTPRVGGVAILAGLGVGAALIDTASAQLLQPALLAGLVAFGFGLAEDITRKVGVRERLLATMASGVLAWWLTGIHLERLDVWLLDDLLAWLPFSLLMTAMAGLICSASYWRGWLFCWSSVIRLFRLGLRCWPAVIPLWKPCTA